VVVPQAKLNTRQTQSLKAKAELRKHNSGTNDSGKSNEHLQDVISSKPTTVVVKDGFNIPVKQKLISISGSYLLLTSGGYYKDAWMSLKNQELYFYTDRMSQVHNMMITLTPGVFIKMHKEIVDNMKTQKFQKVFPIEINIGGQ
jgi:hypothetical protein